MKFCLFVRVDFWYHLWLRECEVEVHGILILEMMVACVHSEICFLLSSDHLKCTFSGHNWVAIYEISSEYCFVSGYGLV